MLKTSAQTAVTCSPWSSAADGDSAAVPVVAGSWELPAENSNVAAGSQSRPARSPAALEADYCQLFAHYAENDERSLPQPPTSVDRARATEAATRLFDAMDGLGTDEDAIHAAL